MKHAGRAITVAYNGTPVGQVRDIGELGSTRALIDASVYGEDDKDYVLGQKDGNENTMLIVYDPTNTGHDAIEDDFHNDPDSINVLTVAHTESGAEWDVSLRLTSVSFGSPIDGLLSMNVGYKIVAPGVVSTGS